jgi:DNA-3-methyladenine glycosylase
MFEPGGHAYVYLCYGIHHLFNVVTAPAGMAHAVLVRAIEPIYGVETMLQRRKMSQLKTTLGAGPGSSSQALGLRTQHTGLAFTDESSPVWIEEPLETPNFQIKTGTRVGIAFAEECAFWPWRFSIAGNPWVSKAKGIDE